MKKMSQNYVKTAKNDVKKNLQIMSNLILQQEFRKSAAEKTVEDNH